ncbi:MAG: TonB-dependent siderophore receptor [Puniceicoccaceae bacterium]
MTKRIKTWFLAGLLAAFSATAHGQTDEDNSGDGEVFELSPFEVSTSGDRGYYASNTISGSRISVPIQDIPLSIEVITSEFIEDTGATDLRDSLKYSAGLLLSSQNDAFGKFDNFGGVNNPEGSTGDKGESSFKVRGFVLENTLRNGFRRKHATDSINIDRIEFIRGPSALLYGVGNFGGIVNYLTKQPLQTERQEINLSYGSDNFKRATIDSTGPLASDKLAYRLTAAYEDKDDWTEINTTEHWFISPVLQWKPFQRVTFTADYEYGRQDEDGIGFKSVRTPTLEGIPIFQADRLETYGMLEFEDKDVRTFRWSGPDTYLDTESSNINFSADIGFTDNFYYRGGLNVSRVRFDSLDIFGGITTDPQVLRAFEQIATIQARQIIDGKSNDLVVPVENAVLQYNWNKSHEDIHWKQVRHEVTYNKRIFQGNRWLESEHNFLAGYSHEEQKYRSSLDRTSPNPFDGDPYIYMNPTDSSYIRFGVNAAGDEDAEMIPAEFTGATTENEGLYFVYTGRFLNDRLFLVGGIREDKTTNRDSFFAEDTGRGIERTDFEDSTIRQQTSQFGISIDVLSNAKHKVSLFALQAEGVEPNFDGQRDGNGVALEATLAEAKEVGLKLNLFEGKISGTVSVFKIKREGLPFGYWWAPSPVKGNFRRADDIIYRLDEWAPTGTGAPDDEWFKNRYLKAATEEWERAIAAPVENPKGDHGMEFAAQKMKGPGGRNEFWYVNASTPQGAAFMDAVFAALSAELALPRDQRTDNDPWPGWLYEGQEVGDPRVNSAAEDWTEGDFFQSINDESQGYEAQFIFSPTDQFQMILNYSHVEREVTNPGNFVQYPYEEGNWDRWAMWYFPNSNWGLAGVPAELVYPGGTDGKPNQDTSTWTGIGFGKGESLDDSPSDTVSTWAKYSFADDSNLSGLDIAIGGNWESGREYASAFTTAGQKKQVDDRVEAGSSIKAKTSSRMTVNAMVRYDWMFRDKYDAFVQVNIDNLLNDKDQYGLLYAPGISWKINVGMTF